VKVIVGSSDIDLTEPLVHHVGRVILSCDKGEPVVVRTGIGKPEPVSRLERLVVRLCSISGNPIVRYEPSRGGRAAVFRRDYEMVTSANAVVCYFAAGREMDGGTGHVVKAALDRGVPVDAYSVRPDGSIEYVGSCDKEPE